MFARSDFYFRLQLPLIIIHITCISLSLRRTSAPIHLTSVLGVLGTQETSCIIIIGLLERDTFDLFLPEFDKFWVIHLRETCCCSTNLCTWRPNTVYKNRSVRRHHQSLSLACEIGVVCKKIFYLPSPLLKSRFGPVLTHWRVDLRPCFWQNFCMASNQEVWFAFLVRVEEPMLHYVLSRLNTCYGSLLDHIVHGLTNITWEEKFQEHIFSQRTCLRGSPCYWLFLCGFRPSITISCTYYNWFLYSIMFLPFGLHCFTFFEKEIETSASPSKICIQILLIVYSTMIW
jgi:hypothetical protein